MVLVLYEESKYNSPIAIKSVSWPLYSNSILQIDLDIQDSYNRDIHGQLKTTVINCIMDYGLL